MTPGFEEWLEFRHAVPLWIFELVVGIEGRRIGSYV